MDASAFTARPARRLRCIWLRLAAGAGRPLLAVSLAGWCLLLAFDGMGGAAHRHAAMPERVAPPAAAWLLMIVAMMPPLISDAVHHLWTRSLRRRRRRAVALFALGYGCVWMTARWMLAAGVMRVVPLVAPGWRAAASMMLVAAFWQMTPVKQMCLNRCHARPPLRTFGLAADRDAVRYGLVSGGWCLGSCWALMLVPPAAGGAHVAAMLGVMMVMVVERQAPCRRPAWRIPFAGTASWLRTASRRMSFTS